DRLGLGRRRRRPGGVHRVLLPVPGGAGPVPGSERDRDRVRRGLVPPGPRGLVHPLAGRAFDAPDDRRRGASDLGGVQLPVPRAAIGDGPGHGPVRPADGGGGDRLPRHGVARLGGGDPGRPRVLQRRGGGPHGVGAVVADRPGPARGGPHPPRVAAAGGSFGAWRWRVFTRVSLPLLLPCLAAAAAVVFLYSFTWFGVVFILGGFRYATLEVEIYRQAVTLSDLPLAAVLAVLQMVGV